MPATLETLPPELQAAVVSYIRRPSDLKSLCLVSKLLRAVAMPKLYHEIILHPSLSGANGEFFAMCHPGHQHVRDLTFTPLTINGVDAESAQKAVRSALLLLPRDNLIRIEMPVAMPLDNDTLATLCTQQKALEVVKLGSMTGPLSQLAQLVQAWLPKLRHLDTVDTVTEPDLELYSNVIRSCAHLSCLGFRLNQWNEAPAPEVASHDLQDSYLQNGVAFERLFGHINTGNGTAGDERIGLRQLWFEETDLSYSDRTFSRVIQFEGLHFLHLYKCPGASILLQELSKQFKERGSSLRGFIYLNHGLRTVDEESNAEAVQNFLRSFSGLEYFQLKEGASGTGFDLRCLTNHVLTLAELYIGEGTNDEDGGHWCASPRDLYFLRQFPRLRQLALAMPQPVLPVTAGREWNEYWNHVEQLAKLPALAILRSLTWPKGPALYKLSENDMFKDLYRRDIDDLANHIVQRLGGNGDGHTARLSVLCIGDSIVEDTVRTEEGVEWTVDGCMCYAVGTVTDRFGFRSPTAIRTERKMVKYIEPLFDVFS